MYEKYCFIKVKKFKNINQIRDKNIIKIIHNILHSLLKM